MELFKQNETSRSAQTQFPNWWMKGDVLKLAFADSTARGKKSSLIAVIEEISETDASLQVILFDFRALTVGSRCISPSELAFFSRKGLKSKDTVEHDFAKMVYRKTGEPVGKTIRLIDKVRGDNRNCPALALLLAAE